MGWRAPADPPGAVSMMPDPGGNLWARKAAAFRYAWRASTAGGSTCGLFVGRGAGGTGCLRLAYMAERRAFGQSIDQFQALPVPVADMEIELQAAMSSAAVRPGSRPPARRMSHKGRCADGEEISSPRQAVAWVDSAATARRYGVPAAITGTRNWCATCGCTRSSRARTKSLRLIVARHYAGADTMTDDIQIRIEGRAGRITLARPQGR